MARTLYTQRQAGDIAPPGTETLTPTHTTMLSRCRKIWRSPATLPVLRIVCLLIFHQFNYSLLVLPRVQLLETSICRVHYQLTATPTEMTKDEEHSTRCKTPGVQHELSAVLSFLTAFDAIPGIIVSGYLGKLADTKGRSLVAFLSLLGETLAVLWIMAVCESVKHLVSVHTHAHRSPGVARQISLVIISIPVRWWRSSDSSCDGFQCYLGHGASTHPVSSLPCAQAELIQHRSRFMYLSPAIAALSSMTAPLIARQLLQRSIWLAFFATFVLDGLSVPLILALPSGQAVVFAKSIQSSRATSPDSAPAQLNDGASLPHPETLGSSSSPSLRQRAPSPACPHKTPIQSRGPNIRTGTSHYSRPLLIGYAVVFFKRAAFMSQDFVYQYVSRVFSWPLAETAKLQSVKAVGAGVVLVALPALSTYAINRSNAKHELTDLAALRTSAIVATIGPALLWASFTDWGLYACKSNPSA